MAVEIEIRDDVLCVTLTGTITKVDMLRIGNTVSSIEDSMALAPPRISDFSASQRMEVGFEEMMALAEHRRRSNLANPVRSATVVSNPLQRGMARMFQTLNDHPLVTIQIFDDREKA
ncbi:MAG: hypothetical protein H7Z40_09830, partial [Phycisphaerae bacterium]|nr:hypothetical protein [Gemmatimonadaceae bacterium]